MAEDYQRGEVRQAIISKLRKDILSLNAAVKAAADQTERLEAEQALEEASRSLWITRGLFEFRFSLKALKEVLSKQKKNGKLPLGYYYPELVR